MRPRLCLADIGFRLNDKNRFPARRTSVPNSSVDLLAITSMSVHISRLVQAQAHVSAMAFAVLSLASIAVASDAVLSLSRLALESPQYSHLLLIVPLTGSLIWSDRRTIFASQNPRLKSTVVCFGLWILVAAVVALFRGTLLVNDRLVSSLLVLVTFWVAAFCACFGKTPARKALFPLMFLFLLIPMPRPVADGIIVFLQRTSADAVNLLYMLAGVPVLRHGQVFVFSNLQLEIARECSGIRSTVALFIVGLLLGHLFLRSKWSSAVLVFAVLPLAIIKNAVRIFTLSVLAIYVDPSFMDSPLHHSGGILFFAVALLFLVLLLSLLMRVEKRCHSPQAQPMTALLSNKQAA